MSPSSSISGTYCNIHKTPTLSVFTDDWQHCLGVRQCVRRSLVNNINSTEPKFYNFTDPSYQLGSNIYRLRQVDYDGTFEYSRSIDISVGMETSFQYKGWTDQVFLYAEATERGQIEVYDLKGSLLNSIQIEARQRIQLYAANLPKGMYLMRFVNLDRQQSEKVVLQ